MTHYESIGSLKPPKGHFSKRAAEINMLDDYQMVLGTVVPWHIG